MSTDAARRKLWETALARGVRLDRADALAVEVGVERATALIEDRNGRAFAQLADRHWHGEARPSGRKIDADAIHERWSDPKALSRPAGDS